MTITDVVRKAAQEVDEGTIRDALAAIRDEADKQLIAERDRAQAALKAEIATLSLQLGAKEAEMLQFTESAPAKPPRAKRSDAGKPRAKKSAEQVQAEGA